MSDHMNYGRRLVSLMCVCALLWQSAVPALAARQVQDGSGGVRRESPGKLTGRLREKPSVPNRGRADSTRGNKLWSAQQARDFQEFHDERRGDRFYAVMAAEPDLFSFVSFLNPGTGANNGGTMPWDGTVGGVNTNTGSLQKVVPITSWPTRGELSVDFRMYHNSKGDTLDANFGYQWKSSYDVCVFRYGLGSTNVGIEFADGKALPYGTTTTMLRPAGATDDISYVGGGTDKYYVTSKELVTYECSRNSGTDPDVWWLTKITDKFGNSITINRNSSNEITSVVDDADSNRTLTFSYSSGRVSSVTDSNRSKTWTFSYNGGSELDTIGFPSLGGASPTVSFTYDGSSHHQILTQTDRTGRTWTYTYAWSPGSGEITSITTPNSDTTTYDYTTTPGDTIVTDPNSNSDIDTYSSGVLALRQDREGSYEVYNSRDANGYVTDFTDKNYRYWQYTFDSYGCMLSEIDPLSVEKDYTYNSDHQLTQWQYASDSSPNEWTYTYVPSGPGAGALQKITNPLSKDVVTYDYDSYGGVIKATDAEGLETEFTRNSHGDVETVTYPDGTMTELDYGTSTAYQQNRGNPLSVTTPTGVTTNVTYDAWLRPISTDTNGDYTYTTLDEEGRILDFTDRDGYTTTYSLDLDGRVDAKYNAIYEAEYYTYDPAGRLDSVENGRGQTRTYEYTNRGELYRVWLPDHPFGIPTEEYSHDFVGNVTGYTTGVVQAVLYEYTDRDELSKIDYPSGTDTTMTYDYRGRLYQMFDATGTHTYGYDNANRKTSLSTPNGSLTYSYLDNDQPDTIGEPGSVVTTYGYDAYGRPDTLTKTNGSWTDVTTWHYDGNGRVDKQTYGNTAYETYAYDAYSRPNDIKVFNSSNSQLRRQQMTYSPAGDMLTHQIDSDPVTTYTYDWIHQLIEEERGTGGNANYYHGVYTYDANGNRATRDITIGTGSTVHNVYTNDSGDKLSSFTHQVGSGGITTYTYTYDAAGRPTSVPVVGSSNRTLVWDYDSHLKTWSAPGGGAAVMTNVYNGAGTRVSSTVTGGNTQLDLRTDIGQTDALLQSDNSSVSDVNYVPGIAERRGSTWTYSHSGIKNIDSQSNGSQSLGSTRTYDAFGTVVASSGSHAGPFGYGGKFGYQEDSAGFKLLGDRWYDPEVGRFLTRDSAHDGRNWYVYCENTPTTYADPTGETAAVLVPIFLADPEPVTKVLLGIGILLLTVIAIEETVPYVEAHRKGKRKSTTGKHEKGEATDQRNQPGGEKGDARRPQKRSKRPKPESSFFLPGERDENSTRSNPRYH